MFSNLKNDRMDLSGRRDSLILKIRHMIFYVGLLLVGLSFWSSSEAQEKVFDDRTGMQWSPVLEWTLENASIAGNPFDLEATAVFFHENTGHTIATPLFYDGNGTWKFRFTGTRTGTWKIRTFSEDGDLEGWTGQVFITENEDPGVHGFMKAFGSKWGWQGTESVFIPQYVMGRSPSDYIDSEKDIRVEMILEDIREFVVEHGFTGFHIHVRGRWFDGNNPDPSVYRVVERFIQQVHQMGGACHICMWGSDFSGSGPTSYAGGPMSKTDRRNLYYLAARLGPLPGWSMGYGLDTENGWARPEEMEAWKSYLEKQMGWDHILGSRVGYEFRGLSRVEPRPPRPPSNAKRNVPVADKYMTWLGGDYMGYAGYRPLYPRYREVIQHRPDKPSFEEERYRLRKRDQYSFKDYTPELTRRGFWHSAMAGGVANIWGNLLPHNQNDHGSEPYDNKATLEVGGATVTIDMKDEIKTYSRFFENRFLKEMDSFYDGPELRLFVREGRHAIIYREDCDLVRLHLQGMKGEQPAVAVDTKKPYKEIQIGSYSSGDHTWDAPYRSDWAISIGDFTSAK